MRVLCDPIMSQPREHWATEDERWCEVCQQDDEVQGEIMPLTVPTPEFPFRVCADCADEWDAMVTDDERQALGIR